ncbi:MAG: hypothetical protein GX491_09865 [Chloroflexi bacterium]|nr:hypothetical protein [Chloroflexota bacterium]
MNNRKIALPVRHLPAKPLTIPHLPASWRALLARIRAAQFVTGLLLGAAFVLFLALVQFSTPDLPDNDGYYHIKLAYLMRTEGLKPAFPWLPLSILNPREFYDHHFLFHVALMPFTFGDLRLGAKWAAVIFAALAFLSAWNLLKNQRVAYAPLWALGLLAVSEAFLYRMSITRAQSLSLAVLMLGLDWLLHGKHRRLALLAFVYVWFYNAFPLLILVAGVYVLAKWMLERRLDLRPILYTTLGVIFGLLINPYFPHNIVFVVQHILPKLVETTAVSVGSEWYPYTTAQLLENSPLALAVLASGILAVGLNDKRIDLRTLAGLGLVCLFGLMLFQSRRFIEYFPAFALVFAAFAWSPLLESRAGSPRLLRRAPALLLALVLLCGAWFTFGAARSSIQAAKPYQTYAGASAWLEANTPAGARVFQTDWDDFPRLFYYNSRNTYLIGLDPTYMLLYNEELYHLWVDVTRGRVERPAGVIQQDFGASYILTDLLHEAFIEQAEQDPQLQEAYRDEYAVIYTVIDR